MLILNKYKIQNNFMIKNLDFHNNLKLITFSKLYFLRSFILIFSIFYCIDYFSNLCYKNIIKNKKNLNLNTLLIFNINYSFLSFY